MEEIRLSASRLVALLLLSTFCEIAAAQSSPQDGIDRNLLQRQQQSAEFHVRLYDDARAVGQDALIPLPPVPPFPLGPRAVPGTVRACIQWQRQCRGVLRCGKPSAAERQPAASSARTPDAKQALRRADSTAAEPDPAASVRPRKSSPAAAAADSARFQQSYPAFALSCRGCWARPFDEPRERPLRQTSQLACSTAIALLLLGLTTPPALSAADGGKRRQARSIRSSPARIETPRTQPATCTATPNRACSSSASGRT